MPLPKDPIKAEETRRKMSEAQKKRYEDPEVRRKISDANKGKKQSPETIEKRASQMRGENHPGWKGGKITKKCQECGKEFSIDKHRSEVARFCSRRCNGKWMSKNRVGEKGAHWRGGSVTKICEECDKEFSVEKSRMETARFCSFACKGVWMSKNLVGENNPSYAKPGKITKENHWAWKGGDITKKCEECGTEFIVERAREKTGRFCSLKCKGIWMSKNLVGENAPSWTGGEITINCEECGKEFKIKRSHVREGGRNNFCSPSCHGKWNSKNLIGKNNPNWTGGSKVYCEKWSLEFRRRIRAFFNNECAECGTPQNEKLLHCHHVYYDKKACCSISEDGKYYSNLGIKDNPHSFEIIGDPNKFIALCDNCHKKTSGKKNREYWARHFEEIINDYYLGRSYFTKEEYEKIK